MSGPRAAAAAKALTGRDPPPPRTAALRRLLDPRDGAAFDQALLLWFPGPRSETGEDLLEIQHHGGRAVLAQLLEVLGTLDGCRPAGPGEFTRRAFLNGKLDLTAAEGLADLVDAQTRAQARQALRQLEGGLGRLYAGWRERLLTALALVEAEIDFAAEEEVPDAMFARVAPDLAALQAEMARHLAAGANGERLREGLVIAVVGAPNVGKSSLVNLLAGREVAIVTAHPGTTRDAIEVAVDLGGLPVTLVDTAGLRETDDPVESIGVARARALAGAADLRLLLTDDPATSTPDHPETLLVVNKRDLAPSAPLEPGALGISCRTGDGVPDLLERLTARVVGLMGAAGEEPLLTRARHRSAVAEAAAALERCSGMAGGLELALLAEELRRAASAIGGITGAVGTEEVLERIFARFCIGK